MMNAELGTFPTRQASRQAPELQQSHVMLLSSTYPALSPEMAENKYLLCLESIQRPLC